MIQEEREANREARARKEPVPAKTMTVRCQQCSRMFQGDLNHDTTCPHCGVVRAAL